MTLKTQIAQKIFDQMQERQKLTNALRSGDLKEAFMPRSYTARILLKIKGIDTFNNRMLSIKRRALAENGSQIFKEPCNSPAFWVLQG